MVSSVGLQPDEQVHSRPHAPSALSGARPYLLSLLLIVLTVGLYYPVKTHPFVNYDDNVYVSENLHVQNGLTWDTLSWAFVSYDAGNWHPLTWLSHALDFQLYDQDPAGHHQTSMLLHALNAVLLFWVLWRATGYLGRSFMVAALFAVHPINVESVVWISERKTLLSMAFFLLALGAYHWYVSKPKVGRYAAVALLFALGLMAKPQIITFPFVLLLWDYWPLRRMSVRKAPATDSSFPQKSFRALVEEKLPLFGIAAASAVMTMKAQSAGGAVLSLASSPLSIRLSNAIVSYVKYIEKALWPVHLAPMYPHPGGSLRAWQVYGGLLILLAITMLVAERRAQRYLLVGWLWFLGTMVPMIGLVQVGRQAMADRYAYLPLLGIFIMICWAVSDYTQDKHLPRASLPGLSCVVILVLTMMAHRQIGYWADNVTLWTRTIEVTAPNYVAQDDLGGALMTQNRLEEAIGHFREAAAIHPVDPISNFNIGFYDQRHGDLQNSIEQYKKAIILTTSPALKIQALNNMGLAYRDMGDVAKARECFEAARRMQGPQPQ
jgi:tetratricopeptide (TPR) repeat protein